MQGGLSVCQKRRIPAPQTPNPDYGGICGFIMSPGASYAYSSLRTNNLEAES